MTAPRMLKFGSEENFDELRQMSYCSYKLYSLRKVGLPIQNAFMCSCALPFPQKTVFFHSCKRSRLDLPSKLIRVNPVGSIEIRNGLKTFALSDNWARSITGSSPIQRPINTCGEHSNHPRTSERYNGAYCA